MEDDVLISEHLSQIVSSQGYQVIAICSNENDAINQINKQAPDYAFLDIRLLGNDLGINIGRKLKDLGIPFMYLTSFSDKKTLKDAVDTHPIGYILKPFEEEEIIQALDKFRQLSPQFILIKSGVKQIKIRVQDILYIKSDNVYLEIYCSNQKYLIRSKMLDFLDMCQVDYLRQVHRSYAVNINMLDSVQKNCLYIEEQKIPTSKKYIADTELLLR